MFISYIQNCLTAIKKFNTIKLLQDTNRYIGVAGIYIPNNLPTRYRMKNPLQGMANY